MVCTRICPDASVPGAVHMKIMPLVFYEIPCMSLCLCLCRDIDALNALLLQ